MKSGQGRAWEAVFQAEIAQIELRREAQGGEGRPARQDLAGLAFSGGGIRSATFCLGVLEGLKPLGLLKKVDYLSTVSGGGYVGAWLSANCRRAADRAASQLKPPEGSADRGAWDAASQDWLDARAPWEKSIAHLRRYSNYLSPQVGFFSADTWSMAAVWMRNTMLVQATVILAIAVLLLVPRLLFGVFEQWPDAGAWRWTSVVLFIAAVAGIAGNQLRLTSGGGDLPLLRSGSWPTGLAVAAACAGAALWLGIQFDFHPFSDQPVDWRIAFPMALLLVVTGFYLLPAGVALAGFAWKRIWPDEPAPREVNYSQAWVQGAVVVPIMATGCLVAATLWGQTDARFASGALADLQGYGDYVTTAWRYWPLPLSVAFASVWLLAYFSMRRREDAKAMLVAIFAPLPAVAVLYALLCAIMLLLRGWAQEPDEGRWLAFVWAPSLVLLAFSLTVVMLIGILGRDSTEAVREWWSRLGAWLGIYGVAWMLVAIAAVYGPRWAALLADAQTWQGFSAVGGWLATTLAALLAGKSDATGSGSRGGRRRRTGLEKLLDAVARIGPFVFIAGLLIGVSTGLHLVILAGSDLPWEGARELHEKHWEHMNAASWSVVLAVLGAAAACLLVMAARVDINEFSLNAFYRSRLARCYLGAARFLEGERSPQRFTGFDDKDDLRMADLGGAAGAPAAGPLHIVNCALNLGGSSDLALHTRHCASFTLSPCAAGSSYLSRDPSGRAHQLGWRPVAGYGGAAGQPTLGQAISVSGAAASPNMGYHTSPVVAFLLTVFNLRLGWWFPNPAERFRIESPSPWFSLRYLAMELFGGADDRSSYLMISDGGHFENLAAYELVRRQCRVIVVCDAECDPELKFEGLGTLIRMCEVDFGARISLDAGAIRPDPGPSPEPWSKWSGRRCAAGTIRYADGSEGILIYLKASMDGREDSAVLQYKSSHPEFPHESTGDQFYGEDQFESYRRLGREIARAAFEGADCTGSFADVAEKVKRNLAR